MAITIEEWIKKQMHKIRQEVAFRMEAKAVLKVPVRTGNLRASITSGVKGNTAFVGAGFKEEVDYAKFVEFGTVKQRPKPFLRPAVFETEKEIPKIMVKWLTNK